MKNMPEILAVMLQGAIQSVLENMRQHMVRY